MCDYVSAFEPRAAKNGTPTHHQEHPWMSKQRPALMILSWICLFYYFPCSLCASFVVLLTPILILALHHDPSLTHSSPSQPNIVSIFITIHVYHHRRVFVPCHHWFLNACSENISLKEPPNAFTQLLVLPRFRPRFL